MLRTNCIRLRQQMALYNVKMSVQFFCDYIRPPQVPTHTHTLQGGQTLGKVPYFKKLIKGRQKLSGRLQLFLFVGLILDLNKYSTKPGQRVLYR